MKGYIILVFIPLNKKKIKKPKFFKKKITICQKINLIIPLLGLRKVLKTFHKTDIYLIWLVVMDNILF